MPVIANAQIDRLLPLSSPSRGRPMILLSGLMLATALGAGGVRAAPVADGLSEQGQAALQHLLQPQAGNSAGVARPDVAAAPATRQQVVVRRGETLDRVIARTSRDSPFRVEVLREVFIRLNRGAFTRGNPNMLAEGSTLVVPTLIDVLGVVDPQRATLAVPPPPAAASAASSGRVASPVTDTDRRNWIRYP